MADNQTKEKRELDSRLSGKFELNGIAPGKIIFKKRTYDFRSMDVKTADALVEAGCRYISKKEKDTKTSTTTGK